MKKMLCALLVLTLTLCLFAVAFSDDEAYHTLTINYRYQTGEIAAPRRVIKAEAGDTVRALSPQVDGYTADIPVVSFEMGDKDAVLVVVYTCEFFDIPEQAVPLAGYSFGMSIGDCFE